MRKLLWIILFTTGAFAQSMLVPAGDVFPSQTRYSSRNVEIKVEKIKKKGCFTEVMVVKAPFGYVLVDGHHHILAALELGYEEIPVYVLEDLSYLDEKSFWQEAKRRGMSYIDFTGKRPTFSTMQDDPNRYFAVLTARRYDEIEQEWFGAEYPVWVKVGKDVPFIELRIADALYARGLVYSYEMGDEPPEEFVEAAREALANAPIEGLRVVPTRLHYKEYESVCTELSSPGLSETLSLSSLLPVQ